MEHPILFSGDKMTIRTYTQVRTPDGMKGVVQGRPFDGMVRVGILLEEQ